MALVNVVLTMGQLEVKKNDVNSFGPRGMLGFMEKRAVLISASKMPSISLESQSKGRE